MTKKELWHVKIGTRVSYPFGFVRDGVTLGTVVRRKVEDDTCGFFIAHNRKTNEVVTKDFYTGRKNLVVTIRFDDGAIRYFETEHTEPWRLE